VLLLKVIVSSPFFFERGEADNRIDGGITYKFTPLILYDISAGIGVSEVSTDYFIDVRFFY